MIVTYEVLEILEESETQVDFQKKYVFKQVKMKLLSPFDYEPRIVTRKIPLSSLKEVKKTKKIDF